MRAWVILRQHRGGAKLNLGPRQGASPALKGLAVCPWWWHRLQMDGLGKGGGDEGRQPEGNEKTEGQGGQQMTRANQHGARG